MARTDPAATPAADPVDEDMAVEDAPVDEDTAADTPVDEDTAADPPVDEDAAVDDADTPRPEAGEEGGAGGNDGLGGADDVDELDVPRRGRTALAVSLVVAVLAVAFVWVLATREPGTDRQASSELIGRAAPAVRGRTLDGGSFDLDDHQGRWVVVNFFATWCVPCQREHPELVGFDEAHRAAGDVRVVSVLYDDSPADAREYFAANGGEWPVVLDDGHIANDYGVTGVPETYLVAPNGRVAVKLVGGVTQSGLDDVISQVEAASPGEEVTG